MGGFDETRAGPASYLGEGSQFTTLKSAVDQAFPGVSYRLTSAITEAYLSEIDVLLLTSARGGRVAIEPLTPEEQAALRHFVDGGGSA